MEGTEIFHLGKMQVLNLILKTKRTDFLRNSRVFVEISTK